MRSRLRSALRVVLLASALAPSEAFAVPARVVAAGEQSVAAVQHSTGANSAFAFGPEGGVVTAAVSGASFHAVTSNGTTISGDVALSRDGLGVAHISGLPLRGLIASRARAISGHAAKYVLGPPLGYEAGRIRYIRMPSVGLSGRDLQGVAGSLPTSFVGAPVVTSHGTLIGSVAGVGAGKWEFAPLALLEELTAVHHSEGVPLLPIVVGGLIVFFGGAVFGVIRAKRRREREQDLRLRQRRARTAAEHRAEGPLVRLRTPPDSEPTPPEEDDFDVIVKPRREDL